MSVTALVEALVKLDAYPAKEILQRFPISLMHRLNAVYEALTDQSAPGSVTQVYRGHDHAEDGGIAVARASVLCCDIGTGTCYTWTLNDHTATPASLTEDTLLIGSRYISPHYATSDLSSQKAMEIQHPL